MEKPDSTVILNCQSRLVNNYLAKVFFIIENNSKQLSIHLNDVKLRIHVIEQLETDLVKVKYTAIYSLSNTVKKFHIHVIYK